MSYNSSGSMKHSLIKYNNAIGYRTGILTFGDSTVAGHGIKLVKVHQGMVINLGASITNDAFTNKDWNKFILSSGVTFGVM